MKILTPGCLKGELQRGGLRRPGDTATGHRMGHGGGGAPGPPESIICHQGTGSRTGLVSGPLLRPVPASSALPLTLSWEQSRGHR